MRWIRFIFLFLFFLELNYAQEKYFIYFVDKGPFEDQLLKTTPENLGISLEAIKRRQKVSSLQNDIITQADLPLFEEYISGIENFAVNIIHKIKWMNAVSITVENKSILNSIEELSFVEKIEPVRKLRFISIDNKKENAHKFLNISSNETIYNYGPSLFQYQISEIPQLHNEGISGEGVRIGLLDSGFNWEDHPSLRLRDVIDEYDFVFNDTITRNQIGDLTNQDYHGTSVFSIIGGFDEGSIVGPAFNSSYLLAKTEFLGTETHIEEDNFARAVEWMENLGVDVISSSVGYNEFDSGEGDYTYEDMDGNSTIVTKAYNFAFERGIVTVTSSGNEGLMPWRYIIAPADAFNVIAAGGIDTSAGSRYRSGSYGPTFDGRIKPDLTAKATSVYNARSFDSGYGYGSGTSFAAPIIAGIAAQLISHYPHLNNIQVRRILLESGDRPFNPDNSFGYGLLSAVDAVNFPNIELTESGSRLYKSFVGNSVSNVNLHIRHFGESAEYLMNIVENKKYSFDLPGYDEGDTLYINFSFLDSSNVTRFLPESDSYKYIYGTKNLFYAISQALNEDDTRIGKITSYPNPFKDFTRIEFFSDKTETARIEIFDILGRKVKSLFNSELSSGKNAFIWNGYSDFGYTVSSGVYIIVLTTTSEIYSKKIILVK